MFRSKLTVMLAISLLFTSYQVGSTVYLKNSDFIQGVFAADPPKAKVIWITKKLRQPLEKILQHHWSQGLRIRYWLKQGKSAWILNEIGKEQPITIGIVIENNEIIKLKILAFRESRGFEIRQLFFTDQFKKAQLASTTTLNKNIDGISGATLSVRAATKMAKTALFLHQQVMQN